MTRRLLLSAGGAGLLPAQKPEVSALDLSLVEGLNIRNELFYVWEHFPPPEGLSAATFKLSTPGRDYSLDEIAALPAKTVAATLESAENPVGGGLVSHADWTGVPLSKFLPAKPTARYVKLTSADGFTRHLPIAKALHPDTLIAYSMNGEKLPLNHGFPLRAIVPGWYGMDSVKWLRNIDLSDEPSRDYLRQERSLFGTRATEPVTEVLVKSVFTRPQEGAILTKRRFLLRGMAWAGEQKIAQVEVSVDGAKTWLPATLDGTPAIYAWTPWSFDWKIPRPGEYTLHVRAKDAQGRQQPAERASNRADPYEQNTPQLVKVTVT